MNFGLCASVDAFAFKLVKCVVHFHWQMGEVCELLSVIVKMSVDKMTAGKPENEFKWYEIKVSKPKNEKDFNSRQESEKTHQGMI